MEITKEYEDGLKLMEELTTNAQQIQEQVLSQILTTNAGTQYLSRFINGDADKQCFKTNVPIVTYEDIKPYIDRIANGETSNILLTQPVHEFHLSTGTSGGLPKLIPVTVGTYNQRAVYYFTLQFGFGDLDKTGKRLQLLFAKTGSETACGLKATTVLTSMLNQHQFRTAIPKLLTSPIETIFCPDNNQSMFCQLLPGLIHRDEVVSVCSTFATVVLRATKFLEQYYGELCSNIRTSRISVWVTDPGCRNIVTSIVKPNPKLADSIENLCGCKSWEGILRKLWPKAKLVDAITTGVMSQYAETLEFYSGGQPLVSTGYICSEAICGINLEPLSKPFEVSYTFLPNMAYFEFPPVEKDGATICLNRFSLMLNLLILIIPIQSWRHFKGAGFHNNTPQFQFIERQNVILSIESDKTSELDLLNVVNEAKTLLDPLGFILRLYTSHVDASSIPGHYVVFWELKAKEGNYDNIVELDRTIMTECCSRMEESLGFIYRLYRKENAIAALEMKVLKQGSFEALMDYHVSQGASLIQYKGPSCIKSKEAINILDSRVMARFFSPKKPKEFG
ncbi:indole-3-acetic acid-amido synthetase GH3.17-like isoform X3 [Gossypium australe]|uniref:Indole-3-acetic acid-amido synthetase GH3.17-like isoform X3 n=1 Tax=Gossypium australe TaxID=47621 RepID=A0A5B6VEN9_9ROSI|nr:indole-3-acetic acid-amido synthetase GH3.17-like isoform X3 [Gossypium australe]